MSLFEIERQEIAQKIVESDDPLLVRAAGLMKEKRQHFIIQGVKQTLKIKSSLIGDVAAAYGFDLKD